MKTKHLRVVQATALAAGLLLSTALHAQTTNRWTSGSSGKWETAGNWSAGAPALSHAAEVITNTTAKTVTIDATTSGSFPGTLTISNLLLSAPVGFTNTLFLNNPGTTNMPLEVLGSCTISNGGVVNVTNGALRVDSPSGGLTIDGNLRIDAGTVLATNAFVGSGAGSQGKVTVAGGTFSCPWGMYIGRYAGATGTVWVTGGQLAAWLDIGYGGVGQLTVSNGTAVSSSSVIVGHYSGSQGTLTVAGGTLSFYSLGIGYWANVTGRVWVTGGQLVSTNGGISVGINGVGEMTVSNGTVVIYGLEVGSSGQGTLTVAGGNTEITGNTFNSGTAFGTGTVWVTGGQLLATNWLTIVGQNGVGQMTVSNGLVKLQQVYVGYYPAGTMTIAGGTTVISSNLCLAFMYGTTGTVWVTGGQLVVTNGSTWICGTYVASVPRLGQLTVSNGTYMARDIYVGCTNYGARGILTVAGGTALVNSSLTVGRYDCSATGTVVIAGGYLGVTNAAHNATLDLRSGTVTVSAGLLQVDRLVITNACGRFIRTGGVLLYNQLVLDPSLDADGDGLPNGWEQTYGLDPLDPTGVNGWGGDFDGDQLPNSWEYAYGLNPAVSTGRDGAGGDPDGDGFTNLQEHLAGTSPINSVSAFRITEIEPWDEDILITWTCVGGKKYALQTAVISGSVSTINFADLGSALIAPGYGESTLSVIHAGGATNVPGRIYRVRLVP